MGVMREPIARYEQKIMENISLPDTSMEVTSGGMVVFVYRTLPMLSIVLIIHFPLRDRISLFGVMVERSMRIF